MSVDYYSCKCCGESRYEEYIGYCQGCGNRICTGCVVNDDIDSEYAFKYGVVYDGSESQREEYGIDQDQWEPKIGDIIDDTGIAPKYCPFCSGDKYTTDMLLEFALDKFEYSLSELIHDYRASRKGDKN